MPWANRSSHTAGGAAAGVVGFVFDGGCLFTIKIEQQNSARRLCFGYSPWVWVWVMAIAMCLNAGE